MGTARAHIIIDYQNIHLTAHGCFMPAGAPAHESLLHPLHLAQQLLLARKNRLAELAKSRGDEPSAPGELGRVSVYRGLPSNRHQPDFYRRSLAQRSEWTRDNRVHVTYRPLRYYFDHGERRAQEKGIDVLIALALTRSADRGEYDVEHCSGAGSADAPTRQRIEPTL